MGSSDSEVGREATARSCGIRRRAGWSGMGALAVQVGRGEGEWGMGEVEKVEGERGEREG